MDAPLPLKKRTLSSTSPAEEGEEPVHVLCKRKPAKKPYRYRPGTVALHEIRTIRSPPSYPSENYHLNTLFKKLLKISKQIFVCSPTPCLLCKKLQNII